MFSFMFRSLIAALVSVAGELHALHHQQQHQHRQIMTALENLTQAVTDAAAAQTELTAAVNAAIVLIGQPSATDAQLNTLAAAIAANTASDAALTAALNAAVNPVVVPPVEPPVTPA